MKKLFLLLLLSLGLNAMSEEICYGRELDYGIATETVIIKKDSDYSGRLSTLNFYDRPPSELFKYCDVGDILFLKDFDWNDSLARVIATYCDLRETQIVYGISSSSAQLVCRLVKARKIKR